MNILGYGNEKFNDCIEEKIQHSFMNKLSSDVYICKRDDWLFRSPHLDLTTQIFLIYFHENGI